MVLLYHDRYEVLLCGDIERLIKKREKLDDPVLYYVTIEETFGVINRAHLATGHGGRDRMAKHLHEKYAIITMESLTLFKDSCTQCQEKKKRPICKGVVVCPILCFGHNLADCRDLENKFLESWKCKILRLEHEICERVKVVTFRTISVRVFPFFFCSKS
jgi:hypothetical protein